MTTLVIVSIVNCVGVAMGFECIEASQKEAFRTAAIVLRRRVLSIEDTTPQAVSNEPGKLALQPSDPGGPSVVTVAVSKMWKGPAASTIQLFVLLHPPFGTGFQFHVGSEYVIYALDEVDQDWVKIRSFSKKSRVYNISMTCRPRVRADVANESRLLDKMKRRK